MLFRGWVVERHFPTSAPPNKPYRQGGGVIFPHGSRPAGGDIPPLVHLRSMKIYDPSAIQCFRIFFLASSSSHFCLGPFLSISR